MVLLLDVICKSSSPAARVVIEEEAVVINELE